MKVLIQRVTTASVHINGAIYSQIGKGLLIFVGIERNDDKKIMTSMAKKVLELRICEDSLGKMNQAITETGGEILVVSQFTLCANLKGGRRPDFFPAKNPLDAKKMYELFIKQLRLSKLIVKSGVFGAKMNITLTNDGPVTFILDSDHI